MTSGSTHGRAESIVHLLQRRECGRSTSVISLLKDFEESSWRAHNWRRKDCRINTTSVLSTIAIAISPNGRMLATSHGDHTVKVFHYPEGTLYQTMRGHPRTPWTVKFHPLDSNIVASGCLGSQVRIWDVAEGKCINMISTDHSIISLSFHPFGQYVAVSTGVNIAIWDWRENLDLLARYPYPPGQGRPPEASTGTVCISHPRNVRAVCFHPGGDYLLAAAPDPPRRENETITTSRLYLIPFSALFRVHQNPQYFDPEASIYILDQEFPYDLRSFPTLLPDVHLYSDGGLDISSDGTLLLTSAKVGVPRIEDRWRSQQQLRHKALCLQHSLGDCTDSNDWSSKEKVGQSVDSKQSDSDDAGIGLSNGSQKPVFPLSSPKFRAARKVNLRKVGVRNGEKTARLGQSSLTDGLNDPSSNTMTHCEPPPPPPMELATPRKCGNGSLDMDVTPKEPKERKGRFTSSPRSGLPKNWNSSRNNEWLVPPSELRLNEALDPLQIEASSTASNMELCQWALRDLPTYCLDMASVSISDRSSPNEGRPYFVMESPGRTPSPSLSPWKNSDVVPAATTSNFTATDNQNVGSGEEHRQQGFFSSLLGDWFDFGSRKAAQPDDSNLPGDESGAVDSFTTPHQFPKMDLSSPPPVPPMISSDHPDWNHCTLLDSSFENAYNVDDAQGHWNFCFVDPANGQNLPNGWVTEMGLCLFRLKIRDGKIVGKALVRRKQLDVRTLKAITCTKLSSSANVALVGYGIREDGVVQGHTNWDVACEVISLHASMSSAQDAGISCWMGGDMEPLAVMRDPQDEINIAQFHPSALGGVVYGTKQGRVRLFQQDGFQKSDAGRNSDVVVMGRSVPLEKKNSKS